MQQTLQYDHHRGCTGHSETVSPDIAGEAGTQEGLMKPLVKQELAQAIRCVLDAKTEE